MDGALVDGQEEEACHRIVARRKQHVKVRCKLEELSLENLCVRSNPSKLKGTAAKTKRQKRRVASNGSI